MLPVGNMPFLEHVIRALAQNSIRDLIIVVGYQKERIMNHFEDGLKYEVRITYVVQDEILGTAHALSKARPYLKDDFLVLNGDNLIDARAIADLISAPGKNVILAAMRRSTGDYGVLTLDEGKVIRITEKPGRPCAGILNTGAYRFGHEIFDEIPNTPISERGSYELTQTLSQMIEGGFDVQARITEGVWADAIFAWDLLNANSIANGLRKPRVAGEVEQGAMLRGPVEVGEGSLIRSGSYVIGPACIGKNCDIGPNATILPSSTICDSVRIGSASEVRNSIIMPGTRIGSACIISDSVVGASCAIGDQVIAESGSPLVEVEERCQRAEFGAIVADNVTVGSRVFLHPGTIAGTDCRIGSGATVRGTLERGVRVI